MMLVGGPLDGEQQIVEAINETIGSLMNFNKPEYQTFAPDGTTIITLGLSVQYAVASQGPPPNVAAGDTWDTSWYLDFVAESFVVPPPFIGVPPVIPDTPAVFMSAITGMIVNANDPNPGVWMYDTTTTLVVVAVTQSVAYATVSMSAVTTLIGSPVDWGLYKIPMAATTTLTVSGPIAYAKTVLMTASSGMGGVFAPPSSATYGGDAYGSGPYGA
jgi:hypothetical protein